jgi:hypothetical protein
MTSPTWIVMSPNRMFVATGSGVVGTGTCEISAEGGPAEAARGVSFGKGVGGLGVCSATSRNRVLVVPDSGTDPDGKAVCAAVRASSRSTSTSTRDEQPATEVTATNSTTPRRPWFMSFSRGRDLSAEGEEGRRGIFDFGFRRTP